MPEKQYFIDLQRALSSERLSSYRRPSDATDAEALGRYFLNICLCEALYPSLQGLEIALRNSIDLAITYRYGGNWLSPTSYLLDSYRQNDIAETNVRLEQDGKPHPNHADLVSGLGFGFWTGLLSANYETGKSKQGHSKGAALWPNLLKEVFPHLPRHERTRQRVAQYFAEMRRLRNRVFHHEPIWHYGDLQQKHGFILEGIGWFSPALRTTIELFDRFPKIYQDGEMACADKLSQHIEMLRQQAKP